MRKIVCFALVLVSTTTVCQKIDCIPFEWQGDTISGRYFEKLAMTVPVKIDRVPENFSMQLDLGAVKTIIYGNTIQPYLERYNGLREKMDSTLTFFIQGEKNYMFKDIDLKLGDVAFGKRNIGHFKGFGDTLAADSIGSGTVKHIGTVAPDLFSNRVLIIDYPNRTICIADSLPERFSGASFQEFKEDQGRIKIPLEIDGRVQDLLFDTGSSLFSLITTEKRADQIAAQDIIDSLLISTWGESYMVYGKETNVPIKYGKTLLGSSTVFSDRLKMFDEFFEEENIWGITGNSFFLEQVLIIDYRNGLFGLANGIR